MRRWGFLSVLLLTAVLLVGCIEFVPSTGGIRGHISIRKGSQHELAGEVEVVFSSQATLSSDYEPLRGAKVVVGSQSGYTDRDGYFEIHGIYPGSYDLTVSHTSLRFDIMEKVYIRGGEMVWLDERLVAGIGHYIVIGINTYPGLDEYNIPGPVKDARRVYEHLFEDNRLAGLGRRLINERAKKTDIEQAVRDAVRGARNPDDYLVIYFSGISGEDHLCAYDSNPRDWKGDVTDGDLEDWLWDFRGSVTVIIDGAESATMADGDPLRPYALRKRKFTVISAAQEGEKVNYDERLDSSVFTHFLLKGIGEDIWRADQNNDGDITARELYDYIADEMYLYYDYNRDSDTHRPSIYEGKHGQSVIFRYR